MTTPWRVKRPKPIMLYTERTDDFQEEVAFYDKDGNEVKK